MFASTYFLSSTFESDNHTFSGEKVWICRSRCWPSPRHSLESDFLGESFIGWKQFAAASTSDLQLNKSWAIISRWLWPHKHSKSYLCLGKGSPIAYISEPFESFSQKHRQRYDATHRTWLWWHKYLRSARQHGTMHEPDTFANEQLPFGMAIG